MILCNQTQKCRKRRTCQNLLNFGEQVPQGFLETCIEARAKIPSLKVSFSFFLTGRPLWAVLRFSWFSSLLFGILDLVKKSWPLAQERQIAHALENALHDPCFVFSCPHHFLLEGYLVCLCHCLLYECHALSFHCFVLHHPYVYCCVGCHNVPFQCGKLPPSSAKILEQCIVIALTPQLNL